MRSRPHPWATTSRKAVVAARIAQGDSPDDPEAALRREVAQGWVAPGVDWNSPAVRRFLSPELRQRQFFERLGTPPENRRRVVFEAGHAPLPRGEVAKETLDFLDRHLGPVPPADLH